MELGVSAVRYFGAPDKGKALYEIIEEWETQWKYGAAGWEYYGNNTAITKASEAAVNKKIQQVQSNPLRSADNKIPHPYHQILVNQKNAYLLGKMVLIRSQDDKAYSDHLKQLSKALYSVLQDAGVDASNTGKSYLQSYINEDGQFAEAHIPFAEGIPLLGGSLSRPLEGFIRRFTGLAYDADGKLVSVEKAAVWTVADVTTYTKGKNSYTQDLPEKGKPNPAPHFYYGQKGGSFGIVPFVIVKNNKQCRSDLDNVRLMIDMYDKALSLFANDVEDLQELIFVLINYGGQALDEFMADLKTYKAIKVEKNGAGADGGVETLKVEIPVEARTKLLEILDKNIWKHGQGVDPSQIPTNPSGAALKHLYGLLELKASFAEAGITEALNGVLRIYKQWLNIAKGKSGLLKRLFDALKGRDYTQFSEDIIFTRSMITNDAETVEICEKSRDIISDETIAANHPWVDDVDAEMEKLRAQRTAKLKQDAEAYLDSDIPPEGDEDDEGADT